MKSVLALSAVVTLSALALAAPTVSAGSCNIAYSTSPYVCVSLDPGTRNEPGLCVSSPGTHCGSPCVLNECVTQRPTSVDCLSAEFENAQTADFCVPRVDVST